MIDDQHVHWRTLGVELQSELFLQRREYRRSVRIDSRKSWYAAAWNVVGRESQRHVVLTLEAGAIDDQPIER